MLFEIDTMINKFIILLLIVASIGNIKAQSILFIGDSYFYWNDTDSLFMDLCQENEREVEVGAAFLEAASLKRQLDRAKTAIDPRNGTIYREPPAIKLLNENAWDYIILQIATDPVSERFMEQSYRPFLELQQHIQNPDSVQIILFINGYPHFPKSFCDYSNNQLQCDQIDDFKEEYDYILKTMSPFFDFNSVKGFVWMSKGYFQLEKKDFFSTFTDEDQLHPSEVASKLQAILCYFAVFEQENPKICPSWNKEIITKLKIYLPTVHYAFCKF